MGRKSVIGLVVILILILVFFFLWNKDYFSRHKQEPEQFSSRIFGKIVEIGNGHYIVIQGGLWDFNTEQGQQKTRTVKFSITPETIFTKKAIVIPVNVEPGEVFYPEVKNTAGSFRDLYPGLAVGVVSRENLFTKDKVVALDIIYEVIE